MFFNIFRQYKINVKQETGGTWKNWSKNIWYDGPANYIKYLKTKEELREILQNASDRGITIRAAGQKHSQPPQIVPVNRAHPWLLLASATTLLQATHAVRNEQFRERRGGGGRECGYTGSGI